MKTEMIVYRYLGRFSLHLLLLKSSMYSAITYIKIWYATIWYKSLDTNPAIVVVR